MALTLKKIELSNIRSHKYICFEPDATGVTAISGPNGSGKSTLVDSVAWTLWGTKPDGVSKAASIVREGTDFKQESAYARLYLQLENSELKIERRFVAKGAGVECEVWEKKDGESSYPSENVAGPAVSHAEAYLKKRLKMDEKGFLAAILVQQKQVDQLISSGPKERALVIERLTGIASITKGLEKARQEYNSMKKVYKMTDVDEGQVEKLKKNLETVKGTLEKKTLERERLAGSLEEAKKQARKLNELLAEEESKAEKIEHLQLSLMESKTRLSSVDEELERVNGLKEAKKKAISALSAGIDFGAIQKELQAVRKSLREKELALSKNDSLRGSLEDELASFKAVVTKAKNMSKEQAQERLAKVEHNLSQIEEKKQASREAIASAQASIKKLANAIKIIEKGNGACPTCLQVVEDPSAAVAGLQEEQAGYEQTIATQKETIETLEETRQTASKQLVSLQRLLEAYGKMEPLEEQLQETVKARPGLETEVKVLEAEVTAQEKVYTDAKRHEEVKKEYQELLDRTVSLSDKAEALKKVLKEDGDALKELSSSAGKGLPALRAKTAKANEKVNGDLVAFGEAKEASSLLAVEVTHLEEKIEQAERELSKYQELMKAVEAAGKTVELLEEFRADRIKTALPLVGAYASDLLARFTDSKFTQLRLDKNFKATVTLADGTERAVGLLSGGELSSAAISLRLAISMLLNSGSSQNVLILDEVLVSQDASRAEQILGTIKDVCRGQVIMISHGPNTNDIADQIFEL